MKVALYARVSTKEQTTENQIRILEKEAEYRGWDGEIIEETMTTRRARPKKAALLERLRAREFEAVCVVKLDRWARSLMELTREVEELYHMGVLFISIHDRIDLSSPTGKLQFQILAAFAEFERNLISQRTKEGLDRKKNTCLDCGHTKGYHSDGTRGCRKHGCDCKKFNGWKHGTRGKDKKPRARSGYWLHQHEKKNRYKKKKGGV